MSITYCHTLQRNVDTDFEEHQDCETCWQHNKEPQMKINMTIHLLTTPGLVMTEFESSTLDVLAYQSYASHRDRGVNAEQAKKLFKDWLVEQFEKYYEEHHGKN